MRPKSLTTLIKNLSHPRPILLHHQTPLPHFHHRLFLSPNPPQPPSHHRTLTTTPPLLKKGGKQNSKRTVPLNAEKTAHIDPFDFSDYEAAIKRAQEQLQSELSRIRAGGLDPDAVEGLRVRLGGGKDGGGGKEGSGKRGKDGGSGGEVVRLRDVASVVVRGRNMGVLVGEKEHIKPILSALQLPPLSLSPMPSPTDPLTLLIPIPPTTQESRRAAQAAASKKGEEAAFALREARGAQRKKHRGMELGRVVGPDELRRAEGMVEKVNERAVGELKGAVERCRKGLEGG